MKFATQGVPSRDSLVMVSPVWEVNLKSTISLEVDPLRDEPMTTGSGWGSSEGCRMMLCEEESAESAVWFFFAWGGAALARSVTSRSDIVGTEPMKIRNTSLCSPGTRDSLTMKRLWGDAEQGEPIGAMAGSSSHYKAGKRLVNTFFCLGQTDSQFRKANRVRNRFAESSRYRSRRMPGQR